MKRLLQINPVLRTSTSTGRIMREIGEAAMSAGWESHMAYSRGRDGVMPCTSEIVPVGSLLDVAWHGLVTRLADRHGLASEHATRRFVERIREIRPDVVHIHNIHGYFLNYKILFDYLSKSGIPVVWTVHDCWLYTGHCYHYASVGCDKWKTGCGHCPQRLKFPASLWLDRSARNWIDKRQAFTSMPQDRLVMVTVSDWMRREMTGSFLGGYGFRVIHNGIDTDKFTVRDSSRVREMYGLGDRHIILGVAGIWSREKGLDDFMALQQRLGPDEVIVLVGVDAAQKRRLPDGIVGIARTDSADALAELYSAADVLVNPTWQDNYPTVNMESIACGTPVVTYRTGGSVESVTAGTGFVVEQGDVSGIMQAVRQIESSGKEVWREHCRRYALEHFRKQDRYADYVSLYEELTMNQRS